MLLALVESPQQNLEINTISATIGMGTFAIALKFGRKRMMLSACHPKKELGLIYIVKRPTATFHIIDF